VVRWSGAHGTALRIDGPRVRLTLRDADEVPLVDLHKEDGAAITIRLPERWASGGSAEERESTSPSRVTKRFAIRAGTASSDEPIALAQMVPAAPTDAPRG